MSNKAIELHDSTVDQILRRDKLLTVSFSEACVHISEGKPGLDKGSVWTQAVELVFQEATIIGALSAFPCDLDGGQLEIDGEVFANLIPIPLDSSGRAELNLVCLNGEKIAVKGKSVELKLLGQPSYLEEFSAE